jgi:hypothetical protein
MELIKETNNIGQAATPVATTTTPSSNKVFDINFSTSTPLPTPYITQDEEYNLSPLANTRQKQFRSNTQGYILHAMEKAGKKSPFTAHKASAQCYPPYFLRGMVSAILDKETGNLLEYCHLIKHPKYKEVWMKSFGTKTRHLLTTTETIFFRCKSNIPTKRLKDITYGRIVCVFRSKKKDLYRTQITMGGNLLNYPDDCGTPTADVLTVKLLLNSVISTNNAKFMTINLKDFYLMMPMSRYKYFHMKLDLFPQDIINQYNLQDIIDSNGKVFCKV